MNISKKQFNYLAWFTLLGFSMIGFAIIFYFQEKTPLSIFESEYNLALQILIGINYGFFAAFTARYIINSRWMKDLRIYFSGIIANMNLKTYHIIFYSLCAGIGEEILFRGAIQPFMGIWITAIVFIALHGYLNPMNKHIILYGMFMILVSAGLGYLYDLMGMISSMTAHFTIDVILFFYLQKNNGTE